MLNEERLLDEGDLRLRLSCGCGGRGNVTAGGVTEGRGGVEDCGGRSREWIKDSNGNCWNSAEESSEWKGDDTALGPWSNSVRESSGGT